MKTTNITKIIFLICIDRLLMWKAVRKKGRGGKVEKEDTSGGLAVNVHRVSHGL